PNAPRLTMPASRYTLAPLMPMPIPMPGTGPLVPGLPGAGAVANAAGSGTLLLDTPPAWTPHGEITGPAFPGKPQPVGGRKWLVISAVLVLALVAALGTGGLAILGNLTGPGGNSGVLPPLGTSAGGSVSGSSATATARATETISTTGG